MTIDNSRPYAVRSRRIRQEASHGGVQQVKLMVCDQVADLSLTSVLRFIHLLN